MYYKNKNINIEIMRNSVCACDIRSESDLKWIGYYPEYGHKTTLTDVNQLTGRELPKYQLFGAWEMFFKPLHYWHKKWISYLAGLTSEKLL